MTAVGTLMGSDGVGADINIPDTAFGDTVTITVIVDNNDTSLLLQTWTVSDIVSGRIDIGSYTALYTAPFLASTGFVTDAAGALTSAGFADVPDLNSNNAVTDNYGFSKVAGLFSNAVIDTQSRQSKFGFQSTDVNLWSVAFVSVPEPGTLALLGFGLFGMGLTRRRKKA